MKSKFFAIALAAVLLAPSISQATTTSTFLVSPDAALNQYSNTIIKAADRLVVLQNSNGSWDWTVTNATGPTGTTYLNITGVTAEGLLNAYAITENAAYLDAAKKAADFIVTSIDSSDPKNINGYNLVFLSKYASASGDSSYSSKASEYLNDMFTVANTRCTGAAGCADVQALVDAYVAYRGASPVPNGVPAWDLVSFVEAAKLLGDSSKASEIATAISTYLSQPGYVNTVDSYDLGLASGVYAAALTSGGSSVFASMLASGDGSYGTVSDGKVQTTAYVLKALKKIGDSRSADAAAYLTSHFGYSGVDGWLETDGTEYSESTSEATEALGTLLSSGLHYYSIQAAVDAANPAGGDTIELSGDATLSSAVTINKYLTVNGNGHIVNAAFAKTDNSNNAGFMVLHSDVTIKNLTVDGASGTNLHGINVYQATGVLLDSVTVSHVRAGVIVNGSDVTVNNITTANNAWGGINVDQGSGVTATTTLTVTGTSNHTETGPDIWIDDVTKNVSVVDAGGQYSSKLTGNTRAYKLPVSVAPTAGSSVSITATSTVPVIVTVPSDVVDAALDFSTLVTGSSVTTPALITINSDSVDFAIPAGTVISSSATWNGEITLPHVSSTTVTPSTGANQTTTLGLVIEVGSATESLTFSKGIRLVFAGQGGKAVGFSHNGGAFVQITNVCTDDSQTTGDALADGSECTIVTGSDTVVWTKHFTTFATYTINNNNSTVTSRSGSSHGGATVASAGSVSSVSSAPATTGRVLGASSFRFSASLSTGASSDAVMELQNRLKAEGYFSAQATGYFGPLTLTAVKAYQTAKGIKATGFVGPLTIAELNAETTTTVTTETVAPAMTVSSFVDLLISHGIISADKVEGAKLWISLMR